jgi:hypothetical protein
LTDASRAGIGQQASIAQSLLGAQQSDLARQQQGQSALAGIATSDAGRALQAAQTDAQINATLANQLAQASEANARTQLSGIGLAPGLLSAEQSLANQAARLGALERGIGQAGNEATFNQLAQQNLLDQNRLSALQAAAGMGSGLFGTTQTTSTPGPSALQSTLGGGLQGLAGAGLAADALGMTLGPYGALAGATVGALAGGIPNVDLLGGLPEVDLLGGLPEVDLSSISFGGGGGGGIDFIGGLGSLF